MGGELSDLWAEVRRAAREREEQVIRDLQRPRHPVTWHPSDEIPYPPIRRRAIMDKYRDKLCGDLAGLVLGLMPPDLQSDDMKQRIWEWLERSDYANEELETITAGELWDEWEWRISGKRSIGHV